MRDWQTHPQTPDEAGCAGIPCVVPIPLRLLSRLQKSWMSLVLESRGCSCSGSSRMFVVEGGAMFGRSWRPNRLVNPVETRRGCRGRVGVPPVRRRSGGSPSFGVGAAFRRNRKWASTRRLAANRRLSFCSKLLLSCPEIVSEDGLDCPSGSGGNRDRSFLCF